MKTYLPDSAYSAIKLVSLRTCLTVYTVGRQIWAHELAHHAFRIQHRQFFSVPLYGAWSNKSHKWQVHTPESSIMHVWIVIWTSLEIAFLPQKSLTICVCVYVHVYMFNKSDKDECSVWIMHYSCRLVAGKKGYTPNLHNYLLNWCISRR